mmetsp:Transcript_59947/g.147327  ORF Transcript_59947/g.147327 Transcript_59947/m.147327 type:complete len:267 (+) Transcript_59947:2065-2865(+)
MRSISISNESSSQSSSKHVLSVETGNPLAVSAMAIFLELAAIMTRGQTDISSMRVRRCLINESKNAAPIFPVLPNKVILAVVSDNVKAWCAARNARVVSSWLTTTATCRSDEPWAINRMLTLANARLPMNVDEIPDEYAIPSPIIATIDIFSHSDRLPIFDRANSNSKVDRNAAIAFSPSFSGTATQILLSELACVMIRTLIDALAIAPINFSATFDPPRVEAPSNVTRLTLSTDVIPLMGMTPFFARQFVTLFPSDSCCNVGLRP